MARYTVTAALPYANGPVHIGHLAGCYLPADCYARYLRLAGNDVLFVCGSDEHGVAITLKAIQEDTTPQAIVDKYHSLIQDTFAEFGVAFDIYGRTSAPYHHKTASEFFLTLYQKGELEHKVSQQYYDSQADQFLADRYIVGTCPNCENPKAYGDQCERCGKSLEPKDLINPTSALTNAPLELRETEHYYLPLNRHQEWLEEWLLGKHSDWKTNVLGQCRSWLQQGLQSRSVTRDLSWGIPVPKEVPGHEGKVLYVWLDAPIGYISITQKWAEERGENWKDWWQGDDARLVHFIGKDNIVFHCITFPSMLRAHGDYILPWQVPANEFLNIEGQKVSTSRNWAVWVHEYLERFLGMQDSLRYVLTANAPETKDADFTWKDFGARHNNELADILGNLANRLSVLTEKHFGGMLPPPIHADVHEEVLLQEIKDAPTKIGAFIEEFRFRDAQTAFMNLARAANKYLTDREPWKLIKVDPEKAGGVIHLGLQTLAEIAVLGKVFLPNTSAILSKSLGVDEHLQWKSTGSARLLQKGQTIQTIPILFPKVEEETLQKEVDLLHARGAQTMAQSEGTTIEAALSCAPLKAEIGIDIFNQLDLRLGTVLQVSKVPKADKLLQLTVDLGFETRTILSGIAQHFAPDELVGKQVVVVANLAPRQMRGITSQGMILMAEDAQGMLMRVSLDNELGAPGSEVR